RREHARNAHPQDRVIGRLLVEQTGDPEEFDRAAAARHGDAEEWSDHGDRRGDQQAGEQRDREPLVGEPLPCTADERAHAGTANGRPSGSWPTWMSTPKASRVAADPSTSDGLPRAARWPPA